MYCHTNLSLPSGIQDHYCELRSKIAGSVSSHAKFFKPGLQKNFNGTPPLGVSDSNKTNYHELSLLESILHQVILVYIQVI